MARRQTHAALIQRFFRPRRERKGESLRKSAERGAGNASFRCGDERERRVNSKRGEKEMMCVEHIPFRRVDVPFVAL